MDAQKVQGYDRVAYGHLAAAYCVVSREADVCLATRSAAQTFGLDFIPLAQRALRSGDAQADHGSAGGQGIPRCSAASHAAAQAGSAGRLRHVANGGGHCVDGWHWRWRSPPVSAPRISTGTCPKGFPARLVPADNPMSAAKVELGRYLVLRQTHVGERQGIVWQLPPSGTGLHRWPGACGRHHRPTSSSQQHEPGERGLRAVADVGESDARFARRAGPHSDARRGADRTRI